MLIGTRHHRSLREVCSIQCVALVRSSREAVAITDHQLRSATLPRPSKQMSQIAVSSLPPSGNPKPSSAAAAPLGDNAAVSKRLQSELMALMMSGDTGISAFPDGDSLFFWVGTIAGADGTVYEGMTFKVSLQFKGNYPFEPPVVRFESPCFHPNVDKYGNICLDILKERWSAAYSVRTVLLSLQSLLGEPNNESPLNTQAAELWADQVQYLKVLKLQYRAP